MDADQTVESVEPEPVHLLRQLFHLEGSERSIESLLGRVYDGWQLPTPFLPWLIGGGCVLILADFWRPPGGVLSSLGLLLSLIGVCTAAEIFWWNKRRTQKWTLERIAQHENVAEVGLLAEAFFWGRRDIQKAVTTALLRLLPQMRVENGHWLTERQRECLYAALDNPNVDLTLALLRAFEQVGDYHALPHVEALAQRTAKTGAREAIIHEAALACLPYLRMEAERARGAQTLLRPSSLADVPADDLVRSANPPEDDLLRPAQGNPEAEPELLLRPLE